MAKVDRTYHKKWFYTKQNIRPWVGESAIIHLNKALNYFLSNISSWNTLRNNDFILFNMFGIKKAQFRLKQCSKLLMFEKLSSNVKSLEHCLCLDCAFLIPNIFCKKITITFNVTVVTAKMLYQCENALFSERTLLFWTFPKILYNKPRDGAKTWI